MFVKVCGITTLSQAEEISQFADYVGYIFHPGSPRNVNQAFPSMRAKKVGVFVDVPLHQVIQTAQLEKLDAVQLHGSEAPEYCAAIRGQVKVIKSFGISGEFDFSSLEAYDGHVDFFLFDTKTPKYGGSGKVYNWNLLAAYDGTTPFILAGGLKPEIGPDIRSFQHPKLAGIDLNSGFESSPGIKNIPTLKQFLHDFRN